MTTDDPHSRGPEPRRALCGQTRTFSFTAVQHVDGTVTGQGQVNNPSFPIRIHFGIDCLKFDEDNRIIASGPIIRSSDPATIAVGRIAVFAVEDNGEGVNAPPDRITTIPDYAPPKSCNEFSFVGDGLRDDTLGAIVRPLIPIEAGQNPSSTISSLMHIAPSNRSTGKP
jgi:hypothetical protein